MPSKSQPHLLLVNPWIYDFAAYDVWSTPLGLLKIAAQCREAGMVVTLVDCLDRFHPQATNYHTQTDGRGPYIKTLLPTPAGLNDIPRRYSRYGIPVPWFEKSLEQLPPPDLIMVTSMMTYWYPGVQFAIRLLRRRFARTPIVLGGIYATLCPQHARRTSGADEVLTGPAEPQLKRLLKTHLGYSAPKSTPMGAHHTAPPAAMDLIRRPMHAPVQTSLGCPFKCAYCASHLIHPHHHRRDPQQVASEIITWHRNLGIINFAIYDDALLQDAEHHFEPLLDLLLAEDLNIRLHTPNAIHLSWLTPALAGKMYRLGFDTIRLGLESTSFGRVRRHDQKVTHETFHQAAAYLREAGFSRQQLGAYLLAGMPDQPMDALFKDIETVCKAGLTPIPAYYTPIPGTDLWPAAQKASRYDLGADPIFSNNAILPCRSEPFTWDYINTLKNHVRKTLATHGI